MSKPLVKRPLFLFLVCLAILVILVPLYCKDGVDDGGLGELLGSRAIIFDTESGDIVLDLHAWCREKPTPSQ